ncbi:hypothetical protein O181_060710 [Austropuccinia psidii MF-1]|uniref:Uncharacterized protein n=1 Tax=Austropuccinia psidii MF-1 TaxID=1389203 RepID=A0A9Q3EDS9_9BASI|nr:hypothetical protein [Austropuccinia psidii MF-1]
MPIFNKPSSPVSDLVSSGKHQFKITHCFSNGFHNPKSSNHRKEDCYTKNPHLRPFKPNNNRKIHISPAAAHLATAHALTTLRISSSDVSNQIVIDCDAAHNMFYSRYVFSSFSNVAKF